MGRIVRIALVTLVFLMAAEGLVRVRASALPPPRKWATTDLDRKSDQIADLERQGGASIVFLGSSTVDSAIDPSELDLGPDDRPAYNAAVRGGTIRMVSTWAREIIPRLRPDVVVLGVASNELDTPGPRERAREQSFFDAPAVRELLGTETPLMRAERHLESVSALFRYRTWLRDPRYVRAAAGLGRAPSVSSSPYGDPVSPDGQFRFFLNRRYKAEVFNAERAATGAGTFGADQRAALRGLLRYVESTVRRLVVVNMPVTTDYPAAQPKGQRSAFEEILRSETRAAHARYISPGFWPKTQFADPTHTNELGSRRLTAMVDEATSTDRVTAQPPQPPAPGVATPTTVPGAHDRVTLEGTRTPSISSVPGVPSPPPIAPQGPR